MLSPVALPGRAGFIHFWFCFFSLDTGKYVGRRGTACDLLDKTPPHFSMPG